MPAEKTTAAKKRRTKYIKSFDTLFPFLWNLAQGCYHRNQFRQLGINGSDYDKNLDLLHFAIPDTILADTRATGGKIFRLKEDSYLRTGNILAPLFSLKSVSPLDAAYFLLLFCFLGNAEQPLTLEELKDKFNELFFDEPDIGEEKGSLSEAFWTSADGRQSYQSPLDVKLPRILRTMAEDGLIVVSRDKNKKLYSLPQDPLEGLSEEELQSLFAAIRFYQASALTALPGISLEKTLCDHYGEKINPAAACFQFTSFHLPRILTDYKLGMLWESLIHHTPIACQYGPKNKIRTGIPVKIVTEYRHDRQYIMLADEDSIKPMRLDRMKKIKAAAEAPEEISTKEKQEKLVPIEIRLYAKGRALQELRRELEENVPDFLAASSTHYILYVNDTLHYLPWLRTLSPDIEILPKSAAHLRDDMRKGLEEVLKNYGAF